MLTIGLHATERPQPIPGLRHGAICDLDFGTRRAYLFPCFPAQKVWHIEIGKKILRSYTPTFLSFLPLQRGATVCCHPIHDPIEFRFCFFRAELSYNLPQEMNHGSRDPDGPSKRAQPSLFSCSTLPILKNILARIGLDGFNLFCGIRRHDPSEIAPGVPLPQTLGNNNNCIWMVGLNRVLMNFIAIDIAP